MCRARIGLASRGSAMLGLSWRGVIRQAERLAARPEILQVRRETIEHPFGSIKQWMNQGYFLMRQPVGSIRPTADSLSREISDQAALTKSWSS
jgi:hypothetical protein